MSYAKELMSFLFNLRHVNTRCQLFCEICFGHPENIERVLYDQEAAFERNLTSEDLERIIRNKFIFPHSYQIWQAAIQQTNLQALTFLHERIEKSYEVTLAEGKSPLHYLADRVAGNGYHAYFERPTKLLVHFFLKAATENHCDSQGYTYFHGACFFDHTVAAQYFMDEFGADVNIDTYACSPLHLAVKYRRVNMVKFLLDKGANANQPDRELSTPLHALARLRVCDCLEACSDNYVDGDKRRPVAEIVDLLVAKGANIEARNGQGLTPLELAVSYFDLELAMSLLKLGASTLSLNENIALDIDKYTRDDKWFYPISLHIVEMIQLLTSYGFVMNFRTRLRILKFWIEIRGSDTNFVRPDSRIYPGKSWTHLNSIEIHLFIHEEFGFFIKPETIEELDRTCERIMPKALMYRDSFMEAGGEDRATIMNRLRNEVAEIKGIVVYKDITLYEICQMTCGQARAIFRQMEDWRLPALRASHRLKHVVKRHVANVLMRPQFELLAADLFMTDYCRLKLPYVACRRVAEYTSDEDLYRLCERTDEHDLDNPVPADEKTFECPVVIVIFLTVFLPMIFIIIGCMWLDEGFNNFVESCWDNLMNYFKFF